MNIGPYGRPVLTREASRHNFIQMDDEMLHLAYGDAGLPAMLAHREKMRAAGYEGVYLWWPDWTVMIWQIPAEQKFATADDAERAYRAFHGDVFRFLAERGTC